MGAEKWLQPYIGIAEGSRVHHPDLVVAKKVRMKTRLLDPHQYLPMENTNKNFGANNSA